MVADDNQANRQLIGLRLRRAGADVVMARDGQEALDRTQEAVEESSPFDAVIMDMQMPGSWTAMMRSGSFEPAGFRQADRRRDRVRNERGPRRVSRPGVRRLYQ